MRRTATSNTASATDDDGAAVTASVRGLALHDQRLLLVQFALADGELWAAPADPTIPNWARRWLQLRALSYSPKGRQPRRARCEAATTPGVVTANKVDDDRCDDPLFVSFWSAQSNRRHKLSPRPSHEAAQSLFATSNVPDNRECPLHPCRPANHPEQGPARKGLGRTWPAHAV